MLYNPAPTLFRLLLSVTCLLFIAGYGYATLSQPPEVNLLARHLSPDIQHWFGTDNLGRDVWLRCFQGAFTSLQIGVGAALCSGVIALVMAAVARIHPRLDLLVRLITDAMLAMPHLLLLILICFTLGGGKSGVIAAVALTHWPRLALILRADAERVAQSDYLTLTYRLGAWTPLLLAISLFSGAIAAMVDGNVIDVSSCGIAQRGVKFSGVWAGAA